MTSCHIEADIWVDGGFLYVEGEIPESWQTAREVKKYCGRTGGIEIDAETMLDWW